MSPHFAVRTSPTAGIVGSAASIHANSTHRSGSAVDRAIGPHLTGLKNAGTVSSTYGIKIESLTDGAQPPDGRYAIHSSDAGAATYLAGDLAAAASTRGPSSRGERRGVSRTPRGAGPSSRTPRARANL